MEIVDVSAEFVDVSADYTTAESYVLSQPSDGERSILMASGSTSTIDARVMAKLWSQACLGRGGGQQLVPRIVTTEVSQVPLSGVAALLEAGNAAGSVTVLDVDVSPSVCVHEAGLGSFDELVNVVKLAMVLKPTRHAAVELLGLLDPKYHGANGAELAAGLCPEALARALQRASGARLVALTAGDQGCALASVHGHAVTCPACPLIPSAQGGGRVVDATGAGDAFLGGLVAGIYQRLCGHLPDHGDEGPVPRTAPALRELARLANAAGAACCESLGGLPTPGALGRVLELHGGGGVEGGGAPMAAFARSLEMDALTTTALAASSGAAASSAEAQQFQASAARVVAGVLMCGATVHVSGIGKSGHVAKRLASSLASTGTPAVFTHAAEWGHGELGNAKAGDVALLLSHSGCTAEVVAAAVHLKRRGVRCFALSCSTAAPTAQANDEDAQEGPPPSPLLGVCEGALLYGLPAGAVEPLGGAPTCSIVAMEALANALVCELIARRRLTREDFKHNHPGGSLGRAL